MGKRSNFDRNDRDYYPTPSSAVQPLLPHLAPNTRFDEPCAGNGALIDALEHAGHRCSYACDIEPLRGDVLRFDAFDIERTEADVFITNPPWRDDILHPLIVHLSKIAPTWLLFHADWMHTIQARSFLPSCIKIVSIGRVSWQQNGVSGKDNCCWYLFDWSHNDGPKFFGR